MSDKQQASDYAGPAPIYSPPTTVPESANQTVPTLTTHPDDYRRHNISDEEVDVFVNSSRDGLTDVMWGAFGAFLGALPSSVNYLVSFVIEKCWPTHIQPLSTQTHIAGVVQLIICAVALSIAAVVFRINKNKCTTAQALADKIRARTNLIRS
jgi:hypothetical protein